MDEAENLSTLIGDIYDAALDGRYGRLCWRRPADLSEARAALSSRQGPCKQVSILFRVGHRSANHESLQPDLRKLNPLHVPDADLFEVGEVNLAGHCMPHEEILASRFYKEWLTPQGIVDAI